ncbi:uncharacterized protein LOC123292892 [Chrysoperla carnea]|uniref:uncharacterized protein LOC123292892 n=1 Tax=Chrysoperla carnea TaxID=189513 RepID=UPI001D08D81C|nr:uncharacterized protein LOC123292892 [Chrysoperla carnea]
MDKLWKHQQLDNNIELRAKKQSTKWEILVTSFIINALVPTTFCSFGIYIMCLEDIHIKVSETIWNPTIFLVSFIISKPWCQELAEFWVENGKKSGRWWTILGVIIAAISIAANLMTNSIFLNTIVTGILAGSGVSIVLEYVKSNVNDHFQLQNPLIRVVDEAALAIGQFIIPHLTYGFIRLYTLQYAPILQSTILIQIIPSILLLKNSLIGLPTIKSRYSDFQRPLALLTDQEMVVFNAEHVTATPEVNTNENGSNLSTFRQWKSLPNISQTEEVLQSNQTQENEQDNKNDNIVEEIVKDNENIPENPNTNIFRLKTEYGVEILPEIPEENEDTCSVISSNTNVYNKNLNRLSVISTKLDEMILRQDAKDVYITDSKDGVLSISNEHSYKILSENTNYNSILSPYKTYRVKKSYRYLKHYIYDWFLRPLKLSLKLNSFYLTLFANLSLYLSWYSFLCFIPVFTKLIDASSLIGLHEPVFIISIAAFLWIVFLIITPWIADLPKRHLKIIFIFGTILKGIGFFVFANSSNHETVTFGSIIFGFGFGAASFTLMTVIKECLGVRNWSLLKKTLYTFTGLTILIFVNLIHRKLNDFNGLTFYFKLIGGFEIFVGLYWFICHIIYMTNNNINSRWNSIDSMYN